MRKLSDYIETARMDGHCYGILRDGAWEKVTADQWLSIREYLELDIKVRIIEMERQCASK